jgi:hypothetical protein
MNLESLLLFWGDAFRICQKMPQSAATKELSKVIGGVKQELFQQKQKKIREESIRKSKLWDEEHRDGQ